MIIRNEVEREFQDLLERARNGCQQAAQELHDKWRRPLLMAIRRHLSGRARKRVDSVDVLQSVWREVYTGGSLGEGFQSPEHLLAYLTRTVINKTLQVNRREIGTEKRDPSREIPLEQVHESQLVDPSETPQRHTDREDAWEQLLASMPSDCQRGLLLLREGRSPEEVARYLGVSVRTVSRMIERARSLARQRRWASCSGTPCRSRVGPCRSSRPAASRG